MTSLTADRIGASIREETHHAPYFMLVFAAIGIADAFYDSYAIYNDLPLWCPPPVDGCNIVANSPFARIFGIPLGYIGLVYYVYMFALAALLALDPYSRGLRIGALIYAAIGVALSAGFFYIQFTYIHAFCIYCLISAVLTIALFLAALRHFTAIRTPAAPADQLVVS
jgi:uncharacterized membrane protein